MAIVVVQNIAPGAAGTDQGAASTYVPTTPFTPGNAVILAFSAFSNTGNSTGATVNGVAMARDVVYNDVGNSENLEIYSIFNIAASGNVVVNWSGAGAPFGNFILRGILEVSGLLSSGALDQAPTVTTGTSNAPSITSGVTTQADELVVAAVCLREASGGDITITQPGLPYVSVANDGNWSTDASGAIAYNIVAAAGAQTATWGFSASRAWAAGMATYKAAATVVPGTPPNGGTLRTGSILAPNSRMGAGSWR